MSKNLERYWQIEYILQQLWSEPHHTRDYTKIAALNKEQNGIVDAFREDERRQAEDIALMNH